MAFVVVCCPLMPQSCCDLWGPSVNFVPTTNQMIFTKFPSCYLSAISFYACRSVVFTVRSASMKK